MLPGIADGIAGAHDLAAGIHRDRARQYAINGERRHFALLRPIANATGQERVRELILDAFAEYESAINQS